MRTTRRERYEGVVSRAYTAFLWSAATMATYNQLGSWWAFGVMLMAAAILVIYGLIVIGMKAADTE